MHANERIARLAGRQHGLVTGAQLRRVGVGQGAVAHRIRTGALRRVHVGVFAVGHDSLTNRGRMLAAVMACGPQAVLSHTHAAHLWELLPPWEEIDLSEVHVTVPPCCARGRRPAIAIHRSRMEAEDRTDHEALPVTSPARTLIDLGELLDPRAVERAVNQAISDRRTSVPELRAAHARCGGRRGTRVMRELLAGVERFDGVTDSVLEEAFLALVRAARLPEPSTNIRVRGMRIDASWRAERVAVELDGYRWHRDRSRVEADRAREMKLRAGGWTPLRYSARQVFDEPLLVVADLSRTLARPASADGGGAGPRLEQRSGVV